MSLRRAVLAVLAVACIAAPVSSPAFAASKGYGCFLVTASEVNIRDRPYSDAKVVGTALKGDILIKRKLLCTLRGYWCAIRAGAVDGYVDKAFMEKITCP